MFDARRLFAVLLGSVALGAGAAGEEDNALAVHVVGFKHAGGHAVAKLFAPGDDVLGCGRWQLAAPIRQGQAELRFPDIAPGAYALVVFHDENDNGEIDHDFLRLPSEPLGFSNGFRPGPLSGLPSFDKLRFAYAPGAQRMEISVK